jgi:hypothetical protein
VFYRWQKELFENGAAAFQGKSRLDHQAEQQRIEFLQKEIQTKDEVNRLLNELFDPIGDENIDLVRSDAVAAGSPDQALAVR